MQPYKEGQGSLARLTLWVFVILFCFLGCVELYSWIQNPREDVPLIDLQVFWSLPLLGVPLSWKFLLCVVLFAGSVWLVRRYLTRPQFVDTLIETEQELKKVSWPTQAESLNATWVVVFVTVLLTLSLFTFDLVLRSVLGLLF